MELLTDPTLIVTQGRVPNAPSADTRKAVFFEVRYSYSSTLDEVSFLESNKLKILERVFIVGYDPADDSHDIDLRFSIRNQFDVRPPDYADPEMLRASSLKITRRRTLFALKDDLTNALNVNDLQLDSVRAMVQFSYVHIGYSSPETVPDD